MTDQTSTGGEPTGPSFKVGELLAIWQKRLWLILAIIITVPLGVGFVVSKRPKVYETSASLVIDNFVPQYLGSQFKDVVELESNWWTAQETLQTELRVIRSTSQGAAVAKALCDKMIGPPEKQVRAITRLLPTATCESDSELETVAGMLQGMLTVTPVRDSRVVQIMIRGNDPEMAALIANTMATVYRDRNLERRLLQSQGAATWLGTEYGDLMLQLNDAERALIEFKKRNGVVAVGIEDQQNDLSSRRKKLSEELNGVQVKLISLKASREQYAGYAANDPLLDATPGVTDTPVIMKLKEMYLEQYAKLIEQKGKYLEKHPVIIGQEARVAAVKADLVREAGLARKGLDAQYAALVRQEKDLKTALESATRDALQLEQRAIEYNRLKRNFDRLSKLSEQVGGRERETSLAGHLKTNNVRILDLAAVPTVHIAPNVTAATAASALVAMVAALALAFLLELLDSTVKTQEDVEHTAKLAFLGIVPNIIAEEPQTAAPPPALASVAANGSKDLYVLTHPKSSVAECCRAIRTNLLFMTPDRPAKTLLVTSPGPQEGKTTTAVNLAITLAQSGLRVLLVDTDLRRPRLHRVFGVPGTSDGVSKAIVGDADVLDMVRETGVPNLSLLPCGAAPPNPAELLHADRFRAIVDKLAQNFDRVIFDSPPIGPVTDAAILARLTEGTVLVAKSRETSRDALIRARRILSGSGCNLLGCVLNALDLTRPGTYGYYYARYGYYGEDDAGSGGGTEQAPRPRASA